MIIFLKTEDEIEVTRPACQLADLACGELTRNIKPGLMTLQLDATTEEFILDYGMIPTIQNFLIQLGGLPGKHL